MVSAINPASPIFGLPTTQSVRDNFQIAHDEISALQAATATGPYLPLIGGSISGPTIFGGGITTYGLIVPGGGPPVNIGSAGSGTVTIGNSTTGWLLNLNGPSNAGRGIRWQTAAVARWQLNCNATIEAGSNVGSDLDLSRFTDAGGSLGNPVFRVFRASGNILINAAAADAGYRLDVFGTTRLNGATTIGNTVGFNNTAPIAKPTITGAKGSNAALASLLTALANYGLITDSTSA
jgi:hypothetical protein